MSDTRRQRLLDQYEDAALQLLMDEYAEAEGKLLLEEFEAAKKRGEVGEIPEELDHKCRQIIHKSYAAQQRRKGIHLASKLIGKVAVFILLLIGLSATIAMSVEAFRIPIINYIVKNDARFSSLLFNVDNSAVPQDVLGEVSVKDCIPEGYSLEYKQINPDGISSYIFTNDESKIISFQIAHTTGMLNFDTEDTQIIETSINGHEAMYIIKDGNRVIWMDTEKSTVYDLFSDGLDEDSFWMLVYTLAAIM